MEYAPAHQASSNDFISGAVAVLGDVEKDGIGGRGAVLVFGDVVILTPPEEDDAVGVLLDAAGLAQVG